ncbi:MAG: sugar ABC transporter substrate-binding protein [Limnochordales bacterium]|nr:sugar ABC transporter substrate-binding protein [Limnochordales bacterium]
MLSRRVQPSSRTPAVNRWPLYPAAATGFLTLIALLVLLSTWGVVLSARAASSRITLRFSEYPRPYENEMLAELIPLFEKQNPDIKIVYEPITDPIKMTTSMVGGTAPDIVCWWSPDLHFWAKQGLLLDLNPYIQKGLFADDIADMALGQVRGFQVNGVQYALPQYLGTVALYYNQDAVERAGVVEPSNDMDWDDFLMLARKLTVRQGNSVKQWGFYLFHEIDRVAYWVRQNGGEMMSPTDDTLCLLDQPAAIKAIQYWADFIHRWKVSPTSAQISGTTLRDAFAGELAATAADGSWSLAFMLPNTRFKLGIAHLPKGPVARSTLANLDGYAIYAGSPHKEAAVRFLKFLVSPEANRLRARYQGLQPARRSVAREWVELLLKQYPNARTAGSQILIFALAAEYAAPEPMFYNPNTAKTMLNQALYRIFQQGEPAEKVLKEVVPALNQKLRTEKQAAGKARR